MKLIVGLGNPGQEYSLTRHNAGFMVVDELAKRWEAAAWRNRSEAQVAEVRQPDQRLLIKPQTFMNLSGVAVGELARWYKVPVQDIIVIYDDLDLPVGRLRLRPQGGSGGHRGIESLLVHLGEDTFTRVRIGIGRPPQGWETADYVLSRFSAADAPLLTETMTTAMMAVECILEKGLAAAMNIYNREGKA